MKNRPNIVIIMVDQLRFDSVGYTHKSSVLTPNIDQLAENGMVFSNAFTHIPICSPSRQSFICGKRPEVFGALWNYGITLHTSSLQPRQYAWTRQMKSAGYQMGYIGKWDVNPTYKPTAYGYDIFTSDEDYKSFLVSNSFSAKFTNGFFGEPDPTPLEFTHTHWIAEQAVERIRDFSRQPAPWHIRIDFSEPHPPYRPAGQYRWMYKSRYLSPWSSFSENFNNKPYIQRQQLLNWGIEDYTWEDWAPIVARYFGVISQMDEAIGMVLRTIEELRLNDETIIIFTSDHGDLCGAHRMMDKHYVMYDDVVRVPLIIKWSKMIDAGVVSEEFTYNHLDIPPTILDILGLLKPKDLHGKSLRNMLFNEALDDWRSHVVSTYNGQQFGLFTQRMIRTKRWKYIWNHTDVDEFYDLMEDPAELHNLVYDKSLAYVRNKLRIQLYRELREFGDDIIKNHWMKSQLLHGRKLEYM